MTTVNLPATFVGAQPPAGNDPYGIGSMYSLSKSGAPKRLRR